MRRHDPPIVLDRPLTNSYWVVPGRLLAGEYPGGSNDHESRPRLAALREAGINSFIDLTEEGELHPYSHLLFAPTRYLRSAIVDASVPNNVSQTSGLITSIKEALDHGYRIYVHCRAGIGRTGLVVGCYLAAANGDGKVALKTLNRLWTTQSERAKQWPKVPQTTAQEDYIRRWVYLSARKFT